MLGRSRVAALVCLVGTVAVGCSSKSPDSSSDSSPRSTSESNGSTSESNASTSDSSTDAPPLEQDDIVVTSTPVKIAAGEERYLCQYVPPLGKDGWIDRITVTNFEGFHHLFVFRAADNPNLSQVPAPCEDESSLTQAQLPVVNGGEFQMPSGVAFVFEKSDGLYLQMHLLNTSTKAIEASLTWSAHTVPANSATPAGMLRFTNNDIDLPPHQETKVTKTCPVPIGVQMFAANGHYHGRAVDYDATIGSMTVVKGITDNHVTFDPAVAIHEGDLATWTCDDLNTTTSPIIFGGSFEKNEMCNFAVYGFPIADSKTFHCH